MEKCSRISAKTCFALFLSVPGIVVLAVAAHSLASSHRASPAITTAASRVQQALPPTPTAGTGDPARSTAAPIEKWRFAYDKLPLRFEQNQGQVDSQVRYFARGNGYQLFLTDREAVLSLESSAKKSAGHTQNASVLRLKMAGSNPNPSIAGIDPLPSKTDYFIGNDRRNWHTSVPSYARVKYRDVYPGIDMLFHGNDQRLEYDFVVAPGANPKSITFDVDGANKLQIDGRGNLEASVAAGRIQIQQPVIFQEKNRKRHVISGRYALVSGHRVGFDIGSYDPSLPLIVDPTVNYGTYLAGTGTDQAFGVALDASGDAYVTGCTTSPTFPANSPNAPVNNPSGNKAIFIDELNPTGSALVYNMILAGNTSDCASAIAVDGKGNIYITGQTFSTTFPRAGTAVQSTPPGGITTDGTTFLSIICPTVSTTCTQATSSTPGLVYSTFLGAAAALNGDRGTGIALDATPDVYVTGTTLSTGLATGNAAQAINNDPVLNASSIGGNAFLAEINISMPTPLLYYSYLGGSTGTVATAVAADASGKAYITGRTYDSNGASGTPFPTTAGAYVPSLAANTNGVGFFTVLDTTQTGSKSLFYSTYFGSQSGTGGGDAPAAIALDQNKRAYIAGSTGSADFFTTTGAFQSKPPVGAHNAFLTKFDATQSGTASLLYSTLFGGTGSDFGNGVGVDSGGNAYIGGYTSSSSTATPPFPITSGALQVILSNTTDVGFVAKLSPSGNGSADLLYSTYLGGTGSTGDFINALAVGLPSSTCNTCAYVAGTTSSSNLVAISAGAFQPTSSTSPDAFVAALPMVATVNVQPNALNFQTQLVPPPITYPFQAVTVTNNSSSSFSLTSYAVGTPFYTAVPDASNGCSQAQNLPAGASCVIDVSFVPTAAQANPPSTVPDTLVINDTLQGSLQQKVSLTGLATNMAPVASISPAAVPFGQVFVTASTSPQTVTLTNVGNAALTVNGISVVPSSTVFTQTNTCNPPVNLAAGQSCTISVTFAPATATQGTPAPSKATLSIVASDSTVPHTVALSGSGVDFAITAPSDLTVNSGRSSTLTLTMTPLGGFTGTVTITCTGEPANANCTPSPTSVTATDGITPQTSTVTVGASSWVAPQERRHRPPISPQRLVLLCLALATLIGLASTRGARKRIAFGAATIVFLVLAGCASNATPGTYTLTLTGTSGAQVHTATVTLTIN